MSTSNLGGKGLAAGIAAAAAFALSLGAADGMLTSAHAAEHGGKQAKGAGKQGSGGAKKGSAKGGRSIEDRVFRAEPDEDSDRPAWAGVKGGKAGGGVKPPGAGTKKGDLYGDMLVLLRDENGEPILVDGKVQVIAYTYVDGVLVPLADASGDPVVIPYNEEGDLVTTMVVDGVTYDVSGAEVDLGRLSVGRSPSKVLDHALDEALAKLTTDGVVIGLDSAGRLTVDGVTIDSPLENLALYDVYMSTGSVPGVTLPDGFNVASLFAAAADKTGTISVDTIVYMNSILGINTNSDYYDFSTYTYDRSDTWSTATAIVLVRQPDGSYIEQSVNLYEVLFNSTDWTDTTAGSADDFAQAADDYLQVLEFVHDNAVR